MSADLLDTLFTNIGAFLLLVFIFVVTTLFLIYAVKCALSQKEHIDTLDEHDKAVILDYLQSGKLPISCIFKNQKKEHKNND